MFNLLPALIGAGTSLIGGAMNRSAQRKANAANSPAGQVAQWEDAGINPIFGISSGGYIPQQATSLGDSFAGAGAQFQRGLELEHEDQLRETALEKENEKLREALDSLAKPVTPGHLKRYGGSLPLPGNGGSNAPVVSTVSPTPPNGSGNKPHGGRSIGDTSWVAPGREVKNAEYESTPLLMEVHNEMTDEPYVVPGSDGDPLDIWQMMGVGLSIAPQWAYRRVRNYAREVSYDRMMRSFGHEPMTEGQKAYKRVKRNKRGYVTGLN